jgi:hypothetical protein
MISCNMDYAQQRNMDPATTTMMVEGFLENALGITQAFQKVEATRNFLLSHTPHSNPAYDAVWCTARDATVNDSYLRELDTVLHYLQTSRHIARVDPGGQYFAIWLAWADFLHSIGFYLGSHATKTQIVTALGHADCNAVWYTFWNWVHDSATAEEQEFTEEVEVLLHYLPLQEGPQQQHACQSALDHWYRRAVEAQRPAAAAAPAVVDVPAYLAHFASIHLGIHPSSLPMMKA